MKSSTIFLSFISPSHRRRRQTGILSSPLFTLVSSVAPLRIWSFVSNFNTVLRIDLKNATASLRCSFLSLALSNFFNRIALFASVDRFVDYPFIYVFFLMICAHFTNVFRDCEENHVTWIGLFSSLPSPSPSSSSLQRTMVKFKFRLHFARARSASRIVIRYITFKTIARERKKAKKRSIQKKNLLLMME